MFAQHLPDMGRRTVLGLAMASVVAAAPWRPTLADTGPQAPVMALNSALLAAMKSGASTSFDARYRALEPVIEQVFNLNEVLAASIGLSWAAMPGAQKAQLATAFRRYTVSSYVSNFNSYNGQSFQILPGVRQIGPGEVVVQTQFVRTDDSPVKLDYVVRQGPAGWQVVDVLTDGSISRVAVQRSDFRQLLLSGGVPALAAGLGRKVASLSGGMLS
jgi:phospholipid transport system substrate-binding protein